MAERDIAERMIEEAIYNPDSVKDGRSSKKIAEKDLGFRTMLRVVYVEQKDRYVVVTAYQRRT